MTPQQLVKKILVEQSVEPVVSTATAYAPANIALIKYWGKRDNYLHLPVTSSLSVSLNTHGATTEITRASHHAHEIKADQITLNQQLLPAHDPFVTRLVHYLDYFRPHADFYFALQTTSTVPIAAGLASSASGFAAVVLALKQFFGWTLSDAQLSILARLGSGSACRSLWHGFVLWQQGVDPQGLDSYATLLPHTWPDLCIGLVMISDVPKQVSSRVGMQQTVLTSPLFSAWPQVVENDLSVIVEAIKTQQFDVLGQISEGNAMAMHATALAARPAVCYHLPETLVMMKKVWELRANGLPVYFTQDAGANLKLIFLEKDRALVEQAFSNLIVIKPFLHSF